MDLKEKYFDAVNQSFDLWAEKGVDTNQEFEILIVFYKADRTSNESIFSELEKMNYETAIKYKRTIIFFKGTELLATKKQMWTAESLLEDLITLDKLGGSHSYRLEHFLAGPN